MNTTNTLLLSLASLFALVPLSGQSIDGRVWENSASGTALNLNSVATHDGIVIATSTAAGVLRFENGTWSVFPGSAAPWDSGTGLSSSAIVSANHILVGSASSTTTQRGVSSWDGNSWSPITNATSNSSQQRVQGLWADPGSGLVIAALQSGRVSRLEAGVWSNLITISSTGDMQAVHGSSTSNIWAVGNGGAIYRSSDTGITWTAIDALKETPYESLNWSSVYTLDSDMTWFTSTTGEVGFWNGETISISSPTTRQLKGIYALSENQVWAIGSQSSSGQPGTLLYYDGEEWNTVVLPGGVDSHTWNAITGDESGRIWIVGNGGVILTSIPEFSQISLVLGVALTGAMIMRSRRHKQV